MIDAILIQYGIDALLAAWLAYVHTIGKCATCKYEYAPKEKDEGENKIPQ